LLQFTNKLTSLLLIKTIDSVLPKKLKPYIQQILPMQQRMRNACKFSGYNVVKLLLENGGQVDLKFMHNAYILNHNDIVKLLLKNGGQVDPECMHNVCKLIDSSMLKFFLDNGGQIDLKCMRNACKFGGYNVVKLLLENGGQVDLKCMHNVCKLIDSSMLKLLLDNGGQIDLKCMRNACKFSGYDVVKLLLENGGQVDLKCMHNACTRHNAIIKLLLKNSGQVDAECMHIVCKLIDFSMLKLWLKYGGQVDVELLLKNGGQVDLKCMHNVLEQIEEFEKRTTCDYYGIQTQFVNYIIKLINPLLKHGGPVSKEFHRSISKLRYTERITNLPSYKRAFFLTQRSFVLGEKADIANFKKDPCADCHFWWRMCLLPDELVGIVLSH